MTMIPCLEVVEGGAVYNPTLSMLRCLLEGMQWLLDPSATVKVAGKSGISQARSRLGVEPLKSLYAAIVAPIAERRTKCAWYRDWRLISLDGSTLDTADTVANERASGRPGASGSTTWPLTFTPGSDTIWMSARRLCPGASSRICAAARSSACG